MFHPLRSVSFRTPVSFYPFFLLEANRDPSNAILSCRLMVAGSGCSLRKGNVSCSSQGSKEESHGTSTEERRGSGNGSGGFAARRGARGRCRAGKRALLVNVSK